MTPGTVVRYQEEVSASWISRALKQSVDSIRIDASSGNWSSQLSIEAQMADGTTRALRLKVCLGDTFGRSEVDYYTRDYVRMVNAPLVRCFDAQYEPGVGYHLLLEDLRTTHTDNKLIAPNLAYGTAVAVALGRLHAHHWCSQAAPDGAALDRYFDEVRPGLLPMERATGVPLREKFALHEHAFRQRWANPQGMSLLHGDLNPTNILTPTGREAPPYFLDRQPFDWSLTYGVAASDLAYFMIPWWPEQERKQCEFTVLRNWYDALSAPEYSWTQAQADWRLSVEQCLNVPMEWCSKPATMESMLWLWQTQFSRVQSALAQSRGDA
jgi:Phosphotransferase enzyme family